MERESEKSRIEEIERKLGRFEDCKKVMIVGSRDCIDVEPYGVEVWDVDKIMEQLKT